MLTAGTKGTPPSHMYLQPEASSSRISSIALPLNVDSPASDMMANDQSSSQAAASLSNKQRPYPCAACKKSKVKCDEVRPVCDRCTRREYEVCLEHNPFSVLALVNNWSKVYVPLVTKLSHQPDSEVSSAVQEWLRYVQVKKSAL